MQMKFNIKFLLIKNKKIIITLNIIYNFLWVQKVIKNNRNQMQKDYNNKKDNNNNND